VTDTTLASTSDEVLEAKLKSTAYYQVRQSILGNESTAETIRNPEECLTAYSVESLQARFRQEPQELVSALEDYDSELLRAAEVVELGKARGCFDDVDRLIKSERGQSEQDDDAMDDVDSPFLSRY
jgi:hypothetical protein